MKCTWTTPARSITAVAILVSILCPFAEGGSHHLAHSLATYATTNSFIYVNKFGGQNYGFTKPQLPQIHNYLNLVGFPSYQSLTNYPEMTVVKSENGNAASLEKIVASTSGDVKLLSLNDVPNYLSLSTAAAKVDSDSDKNKLLENTLFGLEKLEVPSNKESVLRISSDKEIGENLSENSSGPDSSSNNVLKAEDLASLSKSTIDERLRADSKSSLEDLVTRVINAPFRQVSADHLYATHNTPKIDTNSFEPSIENRQDSNLEQPIPFFQPRQAFRHQNLNLQLPGPGNYNFTQQTLPQKHQPSNTFPVNNRFAIPHNNLPFQRPIPILQPTQHHVPQSHQPQQSPSAPQFAPSPTAPFFSNSNGFSIQNPPSQQQFPIQLSSPPIPGFASGPPPPAQEPENGYNPFHLQEMFPEPPYESEFVNSPLDYARSEEQSQRSAAETNAPQPSQLDFAQSTLRNVRTEEILEVVQRKPVPFGCVYNTISYGPNGEDCVEARKK